MLRRLWCKLVGHRWGGWRWLDAHGSIRAQNCERCRHLRVLPPVVSRETADRYRTVDVRTWRERRGHAVQ